MAGPYNSVPILVTGDNISAAFANTYWGQNFDAVFGGLVASQLVKMNSAGNALETAGAIPPAGLGNIPFVGLYCYRSTSLAAGSNANLPITTEYDPYNICSAGTITIPTGMDGNYLAFYTINPNCSSTPGSGRIEVTWTGAPFGTLFMWFSEFWGVSGNKYTNMAFYGSKSAGSTIIPVCNIYNGLNIAIQDCSLYYVLMRLG